MVVGAVDPDVVDDVVLTVDPVVVAWPATVDVDTGAVATATVSAVAPARTTRPVAAATRRPRLLAWSRAYGLLG